MIWRDLRCAALRRPPPRLAAVRKLAGRASRTVATMLALWTPFAPMAANAAGKADPIRPLVVAVDIGHTLDAPGAISARGRSELEFNYDFALDVAAALERLGVEVVLVNADGRIESLAARPASAPDADFFLSIHHDSVSEWALQHWIWQDQPLTWSDRWRGHSMFISRRNPDPDRSLLCGVAIGARLERMGFVPTDKNARRREYADARHAVHFFDNLVVLYRARQPALLFEAGVLKHRDEELELRDPARRARMADAIATGLKACLSVGR